MKNKMGINTINLYIKKDKRANKDKVAAKQNKDILNTFLDLTREYLVTTGATVSLPAMMGSWRFMKYDVASINRAGKRAVFDYKASKTTGKKIKHMNLITGGYWWKFCWYKTKFRAIASKRYYSCTINRPFARDTSHGKERALDFTVTRYFRDKGWQQYAEIPMSKTYLDNLGL